MSISRRNLLLATAASSLVSAVSNPLDAEQPSSRLKILVAGGHPGDPECGCAGTIARYTALGHEAVLLYLNRGEGFCKGQDPTQCGSVRTQEALKACEILKARALFAGQIDGQAVVDDAHYQACQRLLAAEEPNVVFCQWPIDQHRDHRALSLLVLDAWLRTGKTFALYYYEVADDTMMFSPTEFVDISAPRILALRHSACYAHVSQEPDKWYPKQVDLTRFRGTQSGHPVAEGFLRHWESKSAFLP